jgi:hypothetical protein
MVVQRKYKMPNKIRVNLRAASKKCAEVRHLMSGACEV